MTRRTRYALVLLLLVVAAALGATGRKFYDDDPIAREPETQDASKVSKMGISLSYDLLENLFAEPGDTRRVRALDINTVDEVPDSSWFTNRILGRPLTPDEAARGPLTGPGPAPGPMTVVGAKPAGITPGFRLLDSADVLWFVHFDAPRNPEAASAASVVANKIFHALGYWQAENHVAYLDASTLTIGDKAKTVTPSGRIRPLERDDLDKLLVRAARRADGTYRVMASRAIPGKGVGNFRYYGNRPDDPNDVVLHEHRRSLRALKVFGAWTNLVDLKAGNTLDSIVRENGRERVRHYLQDVGSTFGTSALGPRDWDEGSEYLYEGDPTWKRLVTFGFYIRPWQTVPYTEYSSVGRFEGERFDPTTWKPRVPPLAFLNARADDTFWAARRVMAFTDPMIRAIVKTGEFSDPAAEKHLADVLIQRRDTIGRAYLPIVNPIVNVVLGADGLTFGNAAVEARVAEAPKGGYRAEWFTFDNNTGESKPLAAATTGADTRIPLPDGLPTTPGVFVRADISAVDPPHPSWSVPIRTYYKRTSSGWTLVGLERLPE